MKASTKTSTKAPAKGGSKSAAAPRAKKASEERCIWAEVQSEAPWSQWWQELCQKFHWKMDWVVERWNPLQPDFHWSQVLDSLRTFSLFGQTKVLVISNADRALKAEKEMGKLIENLHRGPHRVILQAEDRPSAAILKQGGDLCVWKFEMKSLAEEDARALDRAPFHWIDLLHSHRNLPQVLEELKNALQSGSHPLQLLSLLSRDFRLGRLVHYAQASRFSEAEITQRLRMPAFAVRKWTQRPAFTNTQWRQIFDYLHAADFAMKNGSEERWVLEKLSLDLIGLRQRAKAANASAPTNQGATIKPSRLKSSLPMLWRVETSFA